MAVLYNMLYHVLKESCVRESLGPGQRESLHSETLFKNYP